MVDIFEHAILCNKCGKNMKSFLISKNGFNLRTKKCNKCGQIVIHPKDRMEYEDFMKLKQKEFNVKMRMVGNSYAVSIPREIVDFMKEQERILDNMVRLSFEEAGRLRLMFNTPSMNENSRIVKSREVRIIKNNKPILHTQQFLDSAHPERNKNIIVKKEKEIEEDD
jgi:hypothetical protein